MTQLKVDSVIGPGTFRRVWLLICKMWMVIALGINIMAIVTWILIIVQNLTVFRHTMGGYLGNDITKYPPSDPSNGYVNNTNVPKHFAGAIFATMFEVGMIVLCCITIAGDFGYRFEGAAAVLRSVWASGLLAPTDGGVGYFIIANSFLKVFIGSALGAQSYAGIHTGKADIDTPLYCLCSALILTFSPPFTALAHSFCYWELAKEPREAGKAETV